MDKARRIVVGVVSIIWLTLFFMKIDIPRNIFIVLAGIISISQAIDEWNRYEESKRKIHLFIPFGQVVLIIFVVIYLFS